jgi:predicted secreted Zn-dependent protease
MLIFWYQDQCHNQNHNKLVGNIKKFGFSIKQSRDPRCFKAEVALSCEIKDWTIENDENKLH